MTVLDVDEEKKDILKRYRNLLKVCRPKTNKEDKKLIRKAFHIAAEAHKDMRRKSGEPYIIHPLEVAYIAVAEIGLGTTSVICALLHDVVEDTDYSLADIEDLFGKKVAQIIDGLTKISGIFDHTTSSIQAENFRKILLTLSEDVRVILIKLADRMHNMRTLDSMTEEKKLKIASETVYLYAPLSHRLGLYAIKSELEDLALKYTEPEIFKTITRKIIETELERKRFIYKFLLPIKKELNQQGINYKIIHRTKSVNSIWNKMKKKEIPFEEVYDLFAIRIIIESPLENEKADCWKVYSIVTNHYHPKQNRLRDWISIPKANGYESLHTTVMSRTGKWVEIQIRTTRMDEIAEKGYAAHWKYKNENDADSGLDEWLSRISEILQSPESEDALDFLDDFKLNLFSDEIFVFTPKGDLKTLPVKATVLDFAYNIHSQVGNSSIGAKVNHKLVPLSYVLKSGDQIEIISSKKQIPKEEWLTYATTARAKTQIKNALKDQKKKYTIEGKEILKDYFKQMKIEFTNSNIRSFQTFTDTPGLTDFYYKIATGIIGVNELKEFTLSNEKSSWLNYIKRPFTKVPKILTPETLSINIREQLKSKPEELLLGKNIKEIDYTISKCCNAIPGDDVIALKTKGQGLVIHRTNCPTAIQIMSTHGGDIVKAKWKQKESISFLTGIKFNGIDRIGLLNDILNIISDELTINIRSINIESSENMTEGIAMLYVNDTKHLQNVIDKLKKVNGIQKISRLDN
ncbi:MAG: RelA/SpoT family protein [Saprospiraceae bacterium]|nr:RelA/SpoT family protein [Saprospiraceae bacterium]